MVQNIRRPVTDSYDPKQRVVGGIVLFLLMLLIYLILKIILSVSSPSPHNKGEIFGGSDKTSFANDKTPFAEVDSTPTKKAETKDKPTVVEGKSEEKTLATFPIAEGTPSTTSTKKSTRLIPKNFVFLDIEGNPMQEEVFQTPETAAEAKPTSAGSEDARWVVQAGSFLVEDRAQRLVQQLKDKEITSEIVKIDKWYTVRLAPQPDRQSAEQQLKQLRQKNMRGLIKKVGKLN